MAPDVSYFSHLSLPLDFTQTIRGIFLFSLPIAFLLLILFHKSLKQPLIDLMPLPVQQRLWPSCKRFSFGPTTKFMLILVSLLLGILTHEMWDTCTSNRGWFAVSVVGFRSHLPGPRIWLQPHRIINTVLSIAATVFLWCQCGRWLKTAARVQNTPDASLSKRARHWIRIMLPTAAIVVAAVIAFQTPLASKTLDGVLIKASEFAVLAIPILFLELLLFSVFWHAPRRIRKHAGSDAK
jgi:hypothetical protein